jgi:hypothetical protein
MRSYSSDHRCSDLASSRVVELESWMFILSILSSLASLISLVPYSLIVFGTLHGYSYT